MSSVWLKNTPVHWDSFNRSEQFFTKICHKRKLSQCGTVQYGTVQSRTILCAVQYITFQYSEVQHIVAVTTRRVRSMCWEDHKGIRLLFFYVIVPDILILNFIPAVHPPNATPLRLSIFLFLLPLTLQLYLSHPLCPSHTLQIFFFSFEFSSLRWMEKMGLSIPLILWYRCRNVQNHCTVCTVHDHMYFRSSKSGTSFSSLWLKTASMIWQKGNLLCPTMLDFILADHSILYIFTQ